MIENKDKKMNCWVLILFAIYVISMLYFLLFADAMGRTTTDASYGYNTVLFKEILRYVRNWQRIGPQIVLLNLGGNVLGFIPLGFLLPYLCSKKYNFVPTILTCFFVSLAVELIQLIFSVGCFDVDDMFLNTLGGLIGYLIFMIGRSCRRKKNGQKKKKNL